MSVNSAVVRFERNHAKNKSCEDDFTNNYEGVEKKERSPTLKKNASMIQDDNSHIRRTSKKRNRPMWQLEVTFQCLIAEKRAKYIVCLLRDKAQQPYWEN